MGKVLFEFPERSSPTNQKMPSICLRDNFQVLVLLRIRHMCSTRNPYSFSLYCKLDCILMSQFKYLTSSPTFDELIFGLSLHLNDLEQQHFHLAYNKYQKDRNINEFVEALVPLFTTGPRRTLINPIRNILKPVDVPKYNQLLVRHGYLTTRKPLSMKLQEHSDAKQRAQTLPRNIGSSTPVDGGIKKITLKRDNLGDLGFSIRGGAEYHLGIFISWVDAGSAAAKSGLLVGDQILQVNNVSFEGISHSRAVQHLRKAQRLRIVVLNSQRFPVAKHEDTRYHWIDPISGQPANPPPNSVLDKELLLQDSDVRKVRLETRHNEDLGFSIRGGLEHELGLFLVDVEPNSTAESVGLLPGDLIIDVNGIDFTNISHRDAIYILKSNPVMLITLKHVGKIPVSITSQSGPTEWQRTRQRNASNLNAASQSLSSRTAKKFIQGYGTQVMHQKQQPHTGRHLVEHRSKQLLSEIESNTLMYYLNEYQGHGLNIEAFLTVILDMMDTPEKVALLSDIRQVVHPKDIEYFDRQHRKTRNQVHYDMSQSNEEEHYFSDDQQFDFVPAPLETYQSYNSYDPDMLAALPETSISRTVPDDIAETVISRRRYLSDSQEFDDDVILRKPIVRPGVKSQDSINRAKREAEDLAKKERIIRETEVRVRKETEQRMRDQFELDQQKKQETVEFEIRQEDENRMKMEEELERIRDDTEERIRKEVEEEYRNREEELLREQEDRNQSKLEDIINKRRREEEIHHSNLEEAKRNVERRVKSEVKYKLEAESDEILRRVEEEHNQREQEANDTLESTRKRHQEELESLKLDIEEQAKRQVERQTRKKIEEERSKLQAEAEARKQAESRMFKQEKERIKRLAYENAKREAENKVRAEKDIMRKKQFETERKRKERMLSEAERVAKSEAAKDVASEYELRNVRNVTETVDERNDDDDEGEFYSTESPVREGSPSSERDEDFDLGKIQEAEAKAREEAVRVAMDKAQSRVNEIEREKVSSKRPTVEPVKLRKQPITQTLANPITYDSIKMSDKVEKSLENREILVEHERNKSEKLLQERMRAYMNNQNKRFNEVKAHELRAKAKSYGGFTNLYGEIITIEIKKVATRLGIAVDGGTNTKQKEVKIREIMPGGSAALTADGLRVGQQILEVNGRSLKDLTHKEAVLTVKGAFEADDKVMEMVVLEPENSF